MMLTEAEALDYLDTCIRLWRRRAEENREQGDTHHAQQAACYVDAFQSVRVSLFGSLLEPDSNETNVP